jgi:glycosyltransferase involved in cell wall biosynthesis
MSYLEKANQAFRANSYIQAAQFYELAMREQPGLSNHYRFNRDLALRRAETSARQNDAHIHSTANSCSTLSSLSLADRIPAFLDQQYAKGIIKNNLPLKHDELISIIMPSYNNEAWITRAIHAALSQQEVRVELLVVDDGSTDDSISIARRIAESVPNMRVIPLLRNFGCYYARNIGVLSASGSYVTIIDSDDIMTPDRIVRQMDVMRLNPKAVACRCHQRRWTSDYSQPLSNLRPGLNSLLWKRNLTDLIGWYDSVRFSGDFEFLSRIQHSFGTGSIILTPDESYFTRMLNSSLTTNPENRVHILKEGKLEIELSAPRRLYEETFAAWQKDFKSATPEGLHQIYIDFPMLSRPFRLGSDKQNASPSIGQKRIGAIVSSIAQQEQLRASLETIVPQIDELILYLDDYTNIPNFIKHSKIRAILSQKIKNDSCNNKNFFDFLRGDNAYIFVFDSNLLYPKNYVAWMIHYIEMLSRSSVIGVRGIIFKESNFKNEKQVNTAAWHSSILKPPYDNFETTEISDLWLASMITKRDIPFFSIPCKKDWLNLSFSSSILSLECHFNKDSFINKATHGV